MGPAGVRSCLVCVDRPAGHLDDPRVWGKGFSRRGFSSAVVMGSAAMAAFPREALAAKWETVTREGGILVSTRPEEGREFPSFRGIGRVNANLWLILAVIGDADRLSEWMHKCSGSKRVARAGPRSHFVWNRTDAPNPVKDRDVVLKGSYSVHKEGKEVWTSFKEHAHPAMPPIPGVIRMPSVRGHYHVVAIDEAHCIVEYRVNADPGGSLPKRVVNMISRDVPLHTLVNLRNRVKDMVGEYDDFIAELKSNA